MTDRATLKAFATEDHEQIVGGKYLVNRRDFHKFWTLEYQEKISLWANFRLVGLPFAGGWAEQPGRVADVILTLEQQMKQYEAEQIEKAKAKR